MKIRFMYKGQEYFVICRSYEYTNKITWIYTQSDVKGIRGKITVIQCTLITAENYPSLDGYTNFTRWDL